MIPNVSEEADTSIFRLHYHTDVNNKLQNCKAKNSENHRTQLTQPQKLQNSSSVRFDAL